MLLFSFFIGLLFYAYSLKTYHATEIKVSENVTNTSVAGQGQHGTAKWLTEEEKAEQFQKLIIDKSDAQIANLILKGQEDINKTNKLIHDVDAGNEPTLIQKDSIYEPFSDENVNNANAPLSLYKSKSDITVFDELSVIFKKRDKNYFDKAGIVVDYKKSNSNKEEILCITEDVHTMCLGSTRSGKSRSLVLQSIGMLGLAGESMVVSDPKGELFFYTSKYLKSLDYKVITLDFNEQQKSSSYNVLQPVIDAFKNKDTKRAVDEAKEVANALVSEQNEKIWENGEKLVIAGAILAVTYDNQDNYKYQNMYNVYQFILRMNSSAVNGFSPLQVYIKNQEEANPSHPALDYLRPIYIGASETRASFLVSALTTLELFNTESMHYITQTSDFTIAELGSQKVALFFILPDYDDKYYSIASLLVHQIYNNLVKSTIKTGNRLINRVNFILDEFGNFTKIPSFATKLTVAGSRGIRFNLFLQSFKQLNEKYGDNIAEVIKGNCENLIYIKTGASDFVTKEAVSKLLGNYTTTVYQTSKNIDGLKDTNNSVSVSLHQRQLLDATEISRLRRPEIIVISNANPALCKLPDLHVWEFNTMFGLGSERHNTAVIVERTFERTTFENKLAPEKSKAWDKVFEDFELLLAVINKR